MVVTTRSMPKAVQLRDNVRPPYAQLNDSVIDTFLGRGKEIVGSAAADLTDPVANAVKDGIKGGLSNAATENPGPFRAIVAYGVVTGLGAICAAAMLGYAAGRKH